MRDDRQKRFVSQRGSSLIEAMLAMALLSTGILGLLAANIAAARSDGQALRMSQGTALAQRVVHSLEILPWTSAALTDADAANNGDLDDESDNFLKDAPGVNADHQLNPGGLLATAATSGALTTLAGFSAGDGLDYNGDGAPDFQVFWNVANCSLDANWTFNCAAPTRIDVKRLGVVVRWQSGGRWFKATSQTSMFNPANMGN